MARPGGFTRVLAGLRAACGQASPSPSATSRTSPNRTSFMALILAVSDHDHTPKPGRPACARPELEVPCQQAGEAALDRKSRADRLQARSALGRPACAPVRNPRSQNRSLYAPARHPHDDARRQGDVSDDGRLRRIRARDDPRRGARRPSQGVPAKVEGAIRAALAAGDMGMHRIAGGDVGLTRRPRQPPVRVG